MNNHIPPIYQILKSSRGSHHRDKLLYATPNAPSDSSLSRAAVATDVRPTHDTQKYSDHPAIHKSSSTTDDHGASCETHDTHDKTVHHHRQHKNRIHTFQVSNTRFTIDARYTPLKPLGKGAYGVVCSAIDNLTSTKVAIKKISITFDDVVDTKRTLREVKMLHHFKHENIIGLLDLLEPPKKQPLEDIYMILDYMETDLHKIIYSQNRLTDDHIQYFMYQALRALKFIHSANVIHRDLKPSNLLLNSDCGLKICDFGLARGVKEAPLENDLTEYVVTRWYRAPEVMYSVQDYSYKIDVWAMGCILAELYGRKPLFPGEDYIKQMNLIFEVLGTPSDEDVKSISNKRALQYIRSLPRKNPIPFDSLFPNASSNAIDLMQKMLQFNPSKRITVQQALDHPYFSTLRVVESEVVADKPFDFSFENQFHDRKQLQELMWDEIYHYRPWLKDEHAGESLPHSTSSSDDTVPCNRCGNNVCTCTNRPRRTKFHFHHLT